jgi:hypothetical protein
MGTPQKGYGDYKNRLGGVGWDMLLIKFHTCLKPSCRNHIELFMIYLETQNDPIHLEKWYFV